MSNRHATPGRPALHLPAPAPGARAARVAAGAAPPDDVSLGQAEMLLSDCMIDPDEYAAAVALTDALAYNAGEDGPGQCGGDRPFNDPQ